MITGGRGGSESGQNMNTLNSKCDHFVGGAGGGEEAGTTTS